MNKIYLIFCLGLFLIACKTETKENQKQLKTLDKNKNFSKGESTDSTIYENGIKIHWLKHGKSDSIRKHDLVEIEYKVFLGDGKLVEGSHLFDGTFPFMVGFGMQTKGWDFTMVKLSVGDEVEVFIPSVLARGEKGIKGMIPPNADNILYLKIVEKRKPSYEIDGVKVFTIAQNKKNKPLFNRENTIVFHTMVSTTSNPLYFNSFRENKPFTLKMKDAGVVPGLKKALNNAKKADRLYVVIPPSEGYGNAGLQDVVKPNEYLFYNLYVVDVF
jgi:FKBP-type peptidyl-prolyl cis-trans isomerase